MDAIVIAGGQLAKNDALFELFPGGYKSMINVAGKPMVQWVLDALDKAPSVGEIVLVGLPEKQKLHCSQKSLTMLCGGQDMLENIQYGMMELTRKNSKMRKVLIVSADIPALTSEMVEWEINSVEEGEHDFYYNVISRSMMEATFPASKRSFYPLKDIEVCGADINAVSTEFVTHPIPESRRIIAARKNLYRQAAIVGLDTMFLFLFRLLSLQDAESWLTKRLKIKAHALLCPFAEMGMDIDKPYQLQIVEKFLINRKQV